MSKNDVVSYQEPGEMATKSESQPDTIGYQGARISHRRRAHRHIPREQEQRVILRAEKKNTESKDVEVIEPAPLNAIAEGLVIPIDIDPSGMFMVCLTDEDGMGLATPLKDLVPNLIEYINASGGERQLKVLMHYKDKNGVIRRMIPDQIEGPLAVTGYLEGRNV